MQYIELKCVDRHFKQAGIVLITGLSDVT